MTSINQECPIRAERLKEEWEKLYDGFNDDPAENEEFKEKHQILLRLQRAISWLDGAQRVKDAQEGDVLSTQFIFFWIGFNSLYDRRPHELLEGKAGYFETIKHIKEYFDNIFGSEDAESRICDILQKDISSEINDLIKLSIFLQADFFREYYARRERREEWLEPILRRPRYHIRITSQNARETLDRVFEHLCVLRNQLMHGGSAWDDHLNKEQLFLGVRIMQCLLPVFIEMTKSDNNNLPSDEKKFKEEKPSLLRAGSWLNRARQVEKGLERIGKDTNTQFVFLWIGFNAIYAINEGNLSQDEQIKECFRKLLKCNKAKDTIYNVIDGNILKEKIESLDKEAVILPSGWNRESTEGILCYIFQHFRALRNELVHGHAAWDCELKKSQSADNAKIMHRLLPIFIDIMLKIPEREWKQWTKIWYPRVLGVGIKGRPFEEEKHFNPEKIRELYTL